jgi:hypothetical protein
MTAMNAPEPIPALAHADAVLPAVRSVLPEMVAEHHRLRA